MTTEQTTTTPPAQETPKDPAPGTPEYTALMAARYDQKTLDPEPPPAIPPKPDWGHDKFYDPKTGVYNYEAHIKEQDYRLQQAKGGEPPPAPEAPKDTPPSTDEAQKVVEDAGLNWDELTAKTASGEGLADSDYAALEKSGIPRQIVDNYISAMELAAEALTNRAHSYAGGESEYKGLIDWASANLSDNEKASYNELFGRPDGFKVVIDGLRAKRAATLKTGGEPSLITGGGAGGGGGAFASNEEMMTAIRDPRYDKDPAYRAHVRARIAAMS